jgi:hypothetical protein
MYNPFKPHIVQFDKGTFGIRRAKLSPLRWEYLSNYSYLYNYWLTNLRDVQFGTKVEAEYKLAKHIEYKIKAVRVKNFL